MNRKYYFEKLFDSTGRKNVLWWKKILLLLAYFCTPYMQKSFLIWTGIIYLENYISCFAYTGMMHTIHEKSSLNRKQKCSLVWRKILLLHLVWRIFLKKCFSLKEKKNLDVKKLWIWKVLDLKSSWDEEKSRFKKVLGMKKKNWLLLFCIL